MSTTDDRPVTITDYPVYWFARLADAADRRDSPAVTEARRELLRRGYDVRHVSPRKAVRHAAR
jgi:hypothetical protein